MSRKGNLTREETIAIVGEDAVNKVDATNCHFTSRLQTDGDTRVEFSASIRCQDTDGNDCTLVAYYYQERDAVEAVAELDELNWTVEGYEVI